MRALSQKKNWVVLIFLTASLIISLLFSKFFPKLPVISDSMDYHNIAKSIVEHGSYLQVSTDAIIYPPLYPVFVSIIYAFFGIGDFNAVYIVQYFLVGLLAILIYLTSKKFLNLSTWAAFMAGVALLFWPYLILYSQLISSEILYSFLLSLAMYLFLGINDHSEKWLTVTTGIIFGLAILARPVAILLLPGIMIALFILKKCKKIFGETSVPWKKYFIVFAIMIALLLPWEVYVKVKYARFIPVASNLSFVFNKANKTLSYLGENEQKDKSKISILLKAKLKNIYLFWDPGASGYHLDIIRDKYPVAKYGVIIYKAIFFAILGLAAVGIAKFRKNRVVQILSITILYFWAIHTVLFPFPRYTLPIMPYVIIVAMLTLSYGISYIKTKHTNSRTS